MDIPPTEAASPLKRGRFVNTYKRSPTSARLSLEGECFAWFSFNFGYRTPCTPPQAETYYQAKEQLKVAQQSPRFANAEPIRT
ncbi:hypothetical protein INT44_005074 [Umbelopsis vinacea]|uniref:Uncharacterized protein n=1 Tax=Umbelopsis vinacea TaxID=44442 RepID=A0A8H7UPL7_9FUNG|nr:hypothetical protein INT44_005074 [Umbelopsis vinacea]